MERRIIDGRIHNLARQAWLLHALLPRGPLQNPSKVVKALPICSDLVLYKRNHR